MSTPAPTPTPARTPTFLDWILHYAVPIKTSTLGNCLIVIGRSCKSMYWHSPGRGRGVDATPWGFSKTAKKWRLVAPPGFRLAYEASFEQIFGKIKNERIRSGQVSDLWRHKKYGTTSGQFYEKSWVIAHYKRIWSKAKLCWNILGR